MEGWSEIMESNEDPKGYQNLHADQPYHPYIGGGCLSSSVGWSFYLYHPKRQSEMRPFRNERLMDTGRGEERIRCIEKVRWKLTFSSVQLLSHVQLFVTPWIAARQASLSITNPQSSLKLTSIELVMPSNDLILCCPLLLLLPIPPSIRVFSSESSLLIRWPKYWSFSFSISPSNEHPGLISFRMDWLDLLAVQVTLKSLLQHHSSKASILRCSAFFTDQL